MTQMRFVFESPPDLPFPPLGQSAAIPPVFVAIDFETANRHRSSICQVGLAEFHSGECGLNEAWLINPGAEFDAACIGVHGITPDDVREAPGFSAFYESKLRALLEDRVVVCHSAFDRVALTRACEQHGNELPAIRWMDSAALARRVWPEVSRSGWGLRNLATTRLGIDFRHHNAGEDARVAGMIVLAAAAQLGLDLEACVELAGRPSSRKSSSPRERRNTTNTAAAEPTVTELQQILSELIARPFSEPTDPLLAGERIAITGRLQLTKSEVGAAIEQLGGAREPGVNLRTTTLIVGSHHANALKGAEKSSNQRKAERYQNDGYDIQIFSESEWLELLREM